MYILFLVISIYGLCSDALISILWVVHPGLKATKLQMGFTWYSCLRVKLVAGMEVPPELLGSLVSPIHTCFFCGQLCS